MVGGQSGDGCRRGICAQKRAADEVYSPQGEIANWTHSEMLLAGDAEGSLRHADRGTNFCQVQWRVGVRFQKPLEPRDDRIMTSAAGGHSLGRALGQAPDHQVDQLLLHVARRHLVLLFHLHL